MGIILNHYKDPYSTNRIQWKVRRLHSGKLTARWLENGGPGLSRCMDPIENGDFPASYVIVYQRVMIISHVSSQHFLFKGMGLGVSRTGTLNIHVLVLKQS